MPITAYKTLITDFISYHPYSGKQISHINKPSKKCIYLIFEEYKKNIEDLIKCSLEKGYKESSIK